jgi:hypothetical protein
LRNSTADVVMEGMLDVPFLRLPEQSSDPPAPDSTHAHFFMKDVSGRSKAYMRDSTGVKKLLDETDTLAGATPGDVMVIRKTADQTFTQNNTGFQTVTDLVIPVGAGEVWFIQAFLDLSAVSVNADFKFDYTVPSGSSYKIQRGADTAGVTAGSSPGPLSTTSITLGAVIGEFMAKIEGWFTTGGTPGSVQLRGSQNTAQAEDNKLLTNSFLLARRLA